MGNCVRVRAGRVKCPPFIHLRTCPLILPESSHYASGTTAFQREILHMYTCRTYRLMVDYLKLLPGVRPGLVLGFVPGLVPGFFLVQYLFYVTNPSGQVDYC